MPFGDYVVYVDESGDHSLTNVNPQFPVFVLAFCIFPIAEYIETVVPAIERLKFEFFGHDMVLLHEREIRKNAAPFDILRVPRVRESFQARLTEIIAKSRFGIVACVIDKNELRARRGEGSNPYHVAMEFGLERVFLQLQDRNQVGRPTHVIFEARKRTWSSNWSSDGFRTPVALAASHKHWSSAAHPRALTVRASSSQT